MALALSVPAGACLGLPSLGVPGLMALLFLCGALIIGGQNALNALAGSIYPSFIRADGVGMCFAIVRVGSIFGTVVGGFLIAAKLPIAQRFLITAAPIIIAAPA